MNASTTESGDILVEMMGLCYFCFKELNLPINNVNDITSFQNISTYLKLNRTLCIPPSSSFGSGHGKKENYDLSGLQCESCREITQRFSSVYQELEGVKRHLNLIIKEIHEVMVTAEADEDRRQEYNKRLRLSTAECHDQDDRLNSVEQFRKETIKKCASRISRDTPAQAITNELDEATETKCTSRHFAIQPIESVMVDVDPISQVKMEYEGSELIDPFELEASDNWAEGDSCEADEESHQSEDQFFYYDQSTEEDIQSMPREFQSPVEHKSTISNKQRSRSHIRLVQIPTETRIEDILTIVRTQRDMPARVKGSDFYCNLCKKTVRNKVEHFRAHTREEYYKCNHCVMKFTKSSSRRAHTIMEHYEQPFLTVMQPFLSMDQFRSAVKSLLHEVITKSIVRQSLNSPNKFCAYCGTSLNSSSSSPGNKYHFVEHHFDKLSTRLLEILNYPSALVEANQKEYCGTTLTASTSPTIVGSSDESKIQCETCGQRLSSRHVMLIHERRMHPEHAFSNFIPPGCDTEEVKAAAELSMEEAIRTLPSDGGKECVYCGFQNDRTYKMQVHIVTVHFLDIANQVKRNLTSTTSM